MVLGSLRGTTNKAYDLSPQDFNDRLRSFYQKKTGKYISDRRLKRVSAVILIAFMATCMMVSHLDNAESLAAQNEQVLERVKAMTPAQRKLSARVYYTDSLTRYAASIQASNMIGYDLGGPDSSEMTVSFLGGCVEDNIDYAIYLDGMAERGKQFDDRFMAGLGFTLFRANSPCGTTWERKVGGPHARRLARDANAIAAGIQIIPTASEAGDGHHFNESAPLFVSKEAMHIGMRMILQGMTDADILAPYVSCVASAGDSFISMDGSWTVSEVMITDGPNRGCQGWTANEYIAKR